MSESLIDFAIESSIRHVAARLQIEGSGTKGGRSLKDLLSEIERRCPEAAEILLERTFEKVELQQYLEAAPPIATLSNVDIVGTGDQKFKEHWRQLSKSYPLLVDAINRCLYMVIERKVRQDPDAR